MDEAVSNVRAGRGPGPGYQAKVALLKQPATYPDNPQRVEVVQTHMSSVFLTQQHAYKLKRPVRYDFLDFSTLEAREKDCSEEVRLNRRLARDVYLEVVPLTLDTHGHIALGGRGEIIDWLVKMRRLPADRMLDYLIAHRTIQAADVRKVASVLARFYKTRPSIATSGESYRAEFEHDLSYNFRELAQPIYGLPDQLIDTVHNAQWHVLRCEPALFDRRAAEGRIIEGHGDLRPEHVCLEPKPVIFDCLEFNRQFRIIDPADELSFLAMECERLGAVFVGRELFASYERLTHDAPPERLICFYKTYRACLRARLAIWHTHELEREDWPKWRDRANDYLRLAASYAQQLF
jgi:aminoglycoside phosphotransferase family enzyme